MALAVNTREITAVVLAGGFGTRVKHLLPGLPKPMAMVCGRPFLDWVLLYLAREGITDVVLSTGHLASVIAKHYSRPVVAGTSVQCVAESAPLGTAGGFLNAARGSGRSPRAWLVVNGDSLVLARLAGMISDLDQTVAGVIIGRSVPDATRFGTLRIGDGNRLLGFEEKRSGSGVINAGVYLLHHELLAQFPEVNPLSFETDLFPGWATTAQFIKVHTVESPFLDIGTPETLALAENFIKQNQSWFES